MSYRINPLLGAVAPPPIAEARGWIAGRRFPPDRPLIDLAQGEPSYPPPAALGQHLAGLVGNPETARYTAIEGLSSLRAALAGHIAEVYGGEVAAEQVCITAGCNQAFCLAVMALAGVGDEVVLPTPYYFNHQMWLDMLGVRAVHLPLRSGRGGVPDPADAETRLTPRSRAIVLVTPNNPTGAIYPAATIAAFYELARARGVALVVDETYRDFIPAGGRPHDLFRRPDWPATFVHLYSFSKIYALTGYRVGAVACGPELLSGIAKAMDCVAICAPRIGQQAALYGVEHLGRWRRRIGAELVGRAQALRAAFKRNDLAYELISAGGFFAYLRHPFDGVPAADVARRLAAEHNLLVLPGSMFGPGQEAYLRLAFANVGADLMPEIAARLAASQGAALSARETPRS